MHPFLTISSKPFLIPPDRLSFTSESSQTQELSPKSPNTSHLLEIRPRPKKISPKILPIHSPFFYKRFKFRSPLRRTRSKHLLSKHIHGLNPKFRSESARKPKFYSPCKYDSPKSIQTFGQRPNLELKSSVTKPQPRFKIFQKDAKFVFNAEKFVFHHTKQIPFAKPQKKGKKKSSVKTFASELTSALQEANLSASGILNYSKFCQVLSKVKFIKSPFKKTEEERNLLLKAWKLLGGYQESFIQVADLQFFASVVMNPQFRIDPPAFTSPQHRKRSILTLNSKDKTKLHQEFHTFFLNRTEPKESEVHLSTSQVLTESSEASLNDSSMVREVKENVDEVCKELENFESSAKQFIKKITLKDLVMSSKSANLTWQSTSETPKNFSFREISEDDQIGTPRSVDGRRAVRGQVKKVTVKLDESRVGLEGSVVYRPHRSERFRFHEDGLEAFSEIEEGGLRGCNRDN